MKLFLILVLYLTEFHTIESLKNSKTPLEKCLAPIKETMIQVLLRVDAVEKSLKETNKICLQVDSFEKSIKKLQKQMFKDGNEIHDILEDLLNILSTSSHFSPSETYKPELDCKEKCDQDSSCTSVFWNNNSSDPECSFVKDKSTLIQFNKGEIYYCKYCETTIDLIFEAEYSGVIKLIDIATNKTTLESSSDSVNTNSAKAVDGNKETWFSSEASLTIGEPWLMVDLGERYMVAQIIIDVKKNPIYKRRGGHFQVCLVDTFDPTMNPCSKETEILKVNKRLRNYYEQLDVNRVIMGRYLVIKKLQEEILEIVELKIKAVIPVLSYKCDQCNSKENTICDESKIPVECKCKDTFQLIDGNVWNGCTASSCNDFSEENALCYPVGTVSRKCICYEGHFPVKGDACNYGCKDPCKVFKDRNTICLPEDYKNFECQCKDGYFPVYKDDPCSGCTNPCRTLKFRFNSTTCIPKDSENFTCKCEQGKIPIFFNDPCFGCKSICSNFDGYEGYNGFGCLKPHKEQLTWQSARTTCINEGGDLFTPRDKAPIVPSNLNKGTYWIAVKRDGHGPFKRINSVDQSYLSKTAPIWLSGQPDGGPGECVYLEGSSDRLRDYGCKNTLAFLCQIHPQHGTE